MLSEHQKSLLLDLGLGACKKGLIAPARTIFDGLLANDPAFTPALIGRGLSHLAVDDFEEARLIFQSILDRTPEDLEVRALLGLNEVLCGRATAARILLEPLAGEEDRPAGDLARAALGQL